MAEVPVEVQTPNASGETPTRKGSLSASDTYLIPNDGNTILEVVNKGSEDTVVTIVTPNDVGGNAIADKTVTVAKETGEKVIGPFPKSTYNNAKENIEVKFSKVASVTMAVISLGA